MKFFQQKYRANLHFALAFVCFASFILMDSEDIRIKATGLFGGVSVAIVNVWIGCYDRAEKDRKILKSIDKKINGGFGEKN